MDTIKNIDKLLEKLSSFGEEQVHDIVFCMLKSGLRTSEILNQHPNYSCLSESIKSKNQLNKQPNCLSCCNATVKYNQIYEQNRSFNSFRHAFATYFRDMHDIKNTLGHECINTTLKYVNK